MSNRATGDPTLPASERESTRHSARRSALFALPFAVVSVLVVVGLSAEEHAGSSLPVWFSPSIVVAVPMAFAAAWEICEFASDVILGTTSQSGLEDTMLDVVAGTAGGLLAIVLLITTRRPRTVAPLSLLRG